MKRQNLTKNQIVDLMRRDIDAKTRQRCVDAAFEHVLVDHAAVFDALAARDADQPDL